MPVTQSLQAMKKGMVIIMKDVILKTVGIERNFALADGTNLQVLKNITIDITKNSLTILKGRSGSGKTTLLNLLGALDMPNSGQIVFGGNDIVKYSEARREQLRRNKFGFIFQSVSLIPIMTVYENVDFSLRLSGYKKNHKERVEQCLHMVGLQNRADHMPSELSGGEQQRVAIARAIAHQPELIFADEPTAELDSQTSIHVMEIFKGLISEENVTIVMTTHDTRLMEAGDAIYTVEDGEINHE